VKVGSQQCADPSKAFDPQCLRVEGNDEWRLNASQHLLF